MSKNILEQRHPSQTDNIVYRIIDIETRILVSAGSYLLIICWPNQRNPTKYRL